MSLQNREPVFRSWLEEVVQALRSLRAAPRFSVPALLSLSLGIGAATAVFALFSAVLLRPLPFANEQELVKVMVQTSSKSLSGTDIFGLSAPYVDELREVRSVFASFSAFRNRDVALTAAGEPQRASAALVTPEFFDTLQPEVALGRTFTQRGPAPDSADVAVLRRGFWLTALGGAPVIGRTLLFDGQPKTVVGVVDDAARYPVKADVWLPMQFSSADYESRFYIPLQGIGRLPAGMALAEAQERLRADAVQRNIISPDGTLTWARLESFRERLVGPKREPVVLLSIAVVALFLLACANVAALLVTRALAQGHTLAVRAAVGASSRALVRLCALEALLLSLLGSLLGFLLAAAFVQLANHEWQGLESTPARLDLRVLGSFAVLGLGCALLIGMAPALHALRVRPMQALRGAGRSSTGSGARRLRELLVVVQVAITVVLLGSAGIILRSVRELQRVDPGFDPTAVGLRLLLRPAPQDDDAIRSPNEPGGQLARALLERAERLPGIQAAAIADRLPFGGQIWFSFEVAPGARVTKCHALTQQVSPGYFRALGIGLLSGRGLTAADADKAGFQLSGGAVLVNRTFAREVIGSEAAVGHRISMRSEDDGTRVWLEIVGVVEDVLEGELTRPVEPAVYGPFTSRFRPNGANLTVVVRGPGDPEDTLGALMQAVREVDATVPIYEAEVGAARIQRSYWQTQALGRVLAVFALASLVLAAIGLFGVTSYGVAERSGELGIRRALGASRAQVLSMILRETGLVVACGIALGLAGSWAARRLLASFVYGVSAGDPLTYLAVCGGVSAVTLLAGFAAARPTTRIPPSHALATQ